MSSPLRRAGALALAVTLSLLGAVSSAAAAGDGDRPRTSITAGPSGTVEDRRASFAFTASGGRARFQCRLDGGRWRTCRSRRTYRGLAAGRHRFAVRAVDRAGQVDATPARRAWSVRRAVPAAAAGPSFYDGFTGPDGLITNHYAYWTTDPLAARSPHWEVEGGSLFRRSNTGWTGVPDGILPGLTSSRGTGSAVFRLWTRRRDFRDVRVSLGLRTNAFTAGTAQRPARSWDGVKLMLRRTGEAYYTVETHLRDGSIFIQKKCLGGTVQGGSYHLLAQRYSGSFPVALGRWERVGAVVRNRSDGSVGIQAIRNGRVAASAIDAGAGCAPHRAAAGLGIRTDNANVNFDDFTVVATG